MGNVPRLSPTPQTNNIISQRFFFSWRTAGRPHEDKPLTVTLAKGPQRIVAMTNGNPKLGNNLRQSLGKLCGVRKAQRQWYLRV